MKLLTLTTLLLLASCANQNPTSNKANPYVTIAPTNSYNAMYRVAFKNYENGALMQNIAPTVIL